MNHHKKARNVISNTSNEEPRKIRNSRKKVIKLLKSRKWRHLITFLLNTLTITFGTYPMFAKVNLVNIFIEKQLIQACFA